MERQEENAICASEMIEALVGHARLLLDAGKMCDRLGLEGVRRIAPKLTEKEFHILSRTYREFGCVDLATAEFELVADIAFALHPDPKE
jgi:hypothetical protein